MPASDFGPTLLGLGDSVCQSSLIVDRLSRDVKWTRGSPEKLGSGRREEWRWITQSSSATRNSCPPKISESCDDARPHYDQKNDLPMSGHALGAEPSQPPNIIRLQCSASRIGPSGAASGRASSSNRQSRAPLIPQSQPSSKFRTSSSATAISQLNPNVPNPKPLTTLLPQPFHQPLLSPYVLQRHPLIECN
ncbi:hypothetical protein FHG87_018764 [Trinorchestia longiramus]|nr:hypothetical protein FHG87_018764 [Trinorchestia longiramus]